MCLERYLYLKMKVIDLHTDTLTRKAPEEFNINSNEFMISFEKMKEGNYSAIALAVFLDLGLHKGEMFSLTDRYFDAVDKLLSERKNDFTLFGSSDDSKIQIIRTIEEGEAFEGDIEKLVHFYKRGLRMTTLTWNYPNSLAFPNDVKNNVPDLINGITEKGKEFLMFMNDNNILLDVSHLGDKCFYDAIKYYHLPIVASHSNARSVRNVARNLSDDMIKIIANSGGVIGINLCDYFIRGEKEDYLLNVVRHIEHIRKVGGLNVLALGSDFDGISEPPVLTDCSKWNILFDKLKEFGWKESEIEQLAYKNAYRVLKN